MSDSGHGQLWHTSQNNTANGTSAPAQSSNDRNVRFSMMNLVKVLLFIFNIIFVLVGLTLVGIGIWTAVDKIYISSIIGTDLFSTASYMMIIVGGITSVICVLGMYCVIKKKLRWTMVYFALLIVAALLLLITAVIVVVFQTEVEDAMVDEMRDTLRNGYGSDSDVTDAWNQVQSELQCCAISQTLIGGGTKAYSFPYVDGANPATEIEKQAQDSWPIYKRTQFFKDQLKLARENIKYVPASCCVYDDSIGDYLDRKFCQNFASGPPTNYHDDLKNRFLNYDGCYEKAKRLVMDQAVILIGMGFAFAFVMISGIFLTFLFMRNITTERKSEINRRKEPDNL